MEYGWKFNFHDNYFVMVFDDVKEICGDKSTLTEWLYTDVGDFRGTLEYIDDVISGKTEEDIAQETGETIEMVHKVLKG